MYSQDIARGLIFESDCKKKAPFFPPPHISRMYSIYLILFQKCLYTNNNWVKEPI